jgi:hypothetical protein
MIESVEGCVEKTYPGAKKYGPEALTEVAH